MKILVTIVVVVVAVLGTVIHRLRNKIKRLRTEAITIAEYFEKERVKIHENSKFRSAAANWGFTIENFVPFIDTFPIPSEDVNFLGKPIDFVGFTNTGSNTKCEVHFIEVKSGSAFLSQKQKNIKKAIEEGRVKWHEVRVASNKPAK
jgi:predicted Holliday junction resolvase-like endonuclease